MSERSIRLDIRRIRETRGLSPRALAQASGCTESYISQLEADKAMPSLPMLLKIARALDVTLKDLIDERPCPHCPYWEHTTGDADADTPTRFAPLPLPPASGRTNGYTHNSTLEEAPILALLQQTARRAAAQVRLGCPGPLTAWLMAGVTMIPW